MSDTAKQNVVSLEDYGQTTRGIGSGACAQTLRAVSSLAEKHLARNVSNMMGKIDDALFGRAEMAESSALQAYYQDAMQALRDTRKGVEEDFIKRFTNQFNQGIPRQRTFDDSFMPEGDSPGDADVSLHHSNDEEDRAIANMVHNSREDCADLLPALDRRIGFLMNDPDLEQWQNPLCPEAIGAAFHAATGLIETGLEIRLLILKLFDQYVISNMDELYKATNRYLVKCGVMPDIRSTPNRVADHVDTPQTPSPQQANHSRADQQAGAGRQTSVQSGDMTIDVVAMLFEFILEDRNIPVSMRALLGRLQIPLVKVAMLEPEFFSRKSHPARQLLNALAATAMGWDAQQGHEDPSYRKVEAIVQTIVDDFETDTSLFKTLLKDLDDFRSAEQQQARIRAERSAKVMQGQERLDTAKTVTMQEIASHISDQNDLEFVHEFVTTHWKNLLLITCTRQGKDSDTWKQAVSTLDDLIWSVKPKNTDQERQRLAAIQPHLLKELRQGMERLSIPPTERDAFIARLVDAHGQTSAHKENSGQAADTQSPAASCDGEADGSEAEPREDTPPPTEAAGLVETAVIRAEPATAGTDRENSHGAQIQDLYITAARQLTNGTWMEFLASDGKVTRAKLSWISPINDIYLFTDRQGLKAASYTLQELVELMRCARANIIDATPLMDRAVSSVPEDDH